MRNNSGEICRNCIFFQRNRQNPNALKGTCQRYAPKPETVLVEGAAVLISWPVVALIDWCGEGRSISNNEWGQVPPG